jgi:hypothetical protein
MRSLPPIRLLIPILAGLFMIGCNLLAPQAPSDPNALYTQAAQTIQAQYTQQALSTAVAQVTQQALDMAATSNPLTTSELPGTPLPTTTSLRTATPAPTKPLPTPLPPTATRVPISCDHAKFITDVTIADGTAFTPNAGFTKIWRLQNVGSCAWDRDYSLVFVNGEQMDAPSVVPLTKSVQPGDIVDLSVSFLAPEEPGRYRGYWMLSNDSSETFGIGEDADKPFWVEIRVIPSSQKFELDFALDICTATWRSSAGSLPCQGDPESREGSVVLLDEPDLESGRRENEPTLWTRPETTRDGWIQGVYPPYKVRDGDHFLAEVGCLEDNKDCEVVFSLGYQVSGGRVKSLGEWYEVYDGASTIIDVDLSDLAGKTVQLILGVTNYGKPSHADAYWLVPSIRQVKPSPTQIAYAPAIDAARKRVAGDIGVSIDDVAVLSFEFTEWEDSCLGVKLPDETCGEMIIPGYKVKMQANNKTYEAHTNADGSVVYWFEN